MISGSGVLRCLEAPAWGRGRHRTRTSRWAVPSGLMTIRSVGEMELIRIEYTWFMSIDLPGAGANTIYVNATSAPLTINSLSPANRIFIGDSANGNLGAIAGAVTLRGLANTVTINDSATTAPMTYVMDATHFSRTNTPTAASIFYGGLSASQFNVAQGNGGNDITINGTPTLSGGAISSIALATGSGSDSVHADAGDAAIELSGMRTRERLGR